MNTIQTAWARSARSIGLGLIVFVNAALLMLACFVWIEYLGGFEFMQKIYHQVQGTNIPKEKFKKIHRTHYYGAPLDTDPYEGFTVMHLHPYYIFSLPWTKQAREATNNDVVSVNEYGFRTSIPNNSRLRAAITGGSAAFGHFSSSDGTTLASSLNRLQDRFNFENLNSPSWNSHQELIAVLKNLKRNGSSLSLTIAFTGMNDISVRTYYMQDERYRNLVDVPEAFGQLNNYFDDMRATPKSLAPSPSNRDLKTEYLLRRIFTGPPKPGAEKKWAVHASSDNSLRKKEIEAISNQIVLNHEAIRKLLSANGGRHILIIQPLYGLHESSDPVMREYSEDYYEFVRGVIQRIIGSELCKTDCINLSNVFDRYEGGASIMYGFTESDKPNYIFADEIHLTDKGVDIITVELKKYLQENFR